MIRATQFPARGTRWEATRRYKAGEGGVLALLARCASNGNGAVPTRHGATLELFAESPGLPAALVLEVEMPAGGRMRAEAYEYDGYM